MFIYSHIEVIKKKYIEYPHRDELGLIACPPGHYVSGLCCSLVIFSVKKYVTILTRWVRLAAVVESQGPGGRVERRGAVETEHSEAVCTVERPENNKTDHINTVLIDQFSVTFR